MVRLILLIIILVLALSYFGISIKSIVESPAGQENIAYVWGLVVDAWHSLIAAITMHHSAS